MKSEWKTLWLEALRSDRYKQTTGSLRCGARDGEKKYCALGVLQDIYQQYIDTAWEIEGNDNSELSVWVATGGNTGCCSDECSEEVGFAELDCGDPSVDDNEGFGMLVSSLNDNGMSFKDIADLIEAQL